MSVDGEIKFSTPCDDKPGTPTHLDSETVLPPRVPKLPPLPIRADQKRVSGSAADGQGGTVTWRLIRTNRQG